MQTARQQWSAITSSRWFARGLVLVALGIFNLVIFNRYFPLSEGWWETYGYLYNSGLRPYRDLDLTFTPLFTIVNAGLLRVFGDSFFALRLFGVFVFCAAILVLELLLEQFFSARTAAVAAMASTFLAMDAPQFIAKDYHFYQIGLVALALLLHVRLTAAERQPAARVLGGTALVGAVAVLVFFLKQNVGALLIVAIAASLPLVERERPFARLLAFGAGVAIPLLLMLPVVSLSDWRQLLLANDSKGSLQTVLGRFWSLRENREGILTALAMGGVYTVVSWALAPPAGWQGVLSDPLERLRQRPAVRVVVYVAALALVASSGRWLRDSITHWILPATLAIILVELLPVLRGVLDRSRKPDLRWAAAAFSLVALAYANTTTAVFDFIAMHIPVALAIGWLVSKVEAAAPPRYWFVAALAFLVVVPEIAAARIRVPYYWWGHFQRSVVTATAESDYPQLRGIKMQPEYRETLNTIKRAVDTYSVSRTDAFFFSLPIFYWLHGKLPPHRTVVQWFDVVTSKQMEAELRALREQPPRLVVALEPPEAAYVVHRKLKNTPHLQQEDFRALMDEWVVSGKYRLVRSISLTSGWPGGNEVTQEILVQNEGALRVTTTAALEAAGATGVSVVAARRGDGTPAPTPVLEPGAVLTVRGEYSRVQALAGFLGVARGAPRDWNTVNIYVRADALTTPGTL